MDPVNGISLILALIPFWQRERDNREAATKEEFFEWLIGHNFELVKQYIENNSVLLIQIQDLLKLNQEELLNRFDMVDQKLLRILHSVNVFRNMIAQLAPRTVLSKSEEKILIKFVDSGEARLSCIKMDQGIILQAGSHVIDGWDLRFIDSNLQNLVNSGYILPDNRKDGHSCYRLTEDGYEYVQNLRGNASFTPQAEDILLQYYQADQSYLITALDGQGNVDCVQANNVEISFSDPNYVHDDLESLEKFGLIKFDGNLRFGGRRYTRTRKGAEYVANKLKR